VTGPVNTWPTLEDPYQICWRRKLDP